MSRFVFWGICLPLLLSLLMRFLHVVHFSGGVCESKARLDGKTVVITGANTGIGKETAVDLASRGARVIMACRDERRAQAAVEEVKRRAKTENVVFMKLDLASMESIEEFTEEFRKKEKHLHILINNAGIMAVPRGKTQDGFELQIGVNHLGHFLLTNLMLDIIEASGPGSRIVTVSSLAHRRGGNFDVHDLMMEKRPYEKWYQYGNSKLANILFTKELARQMEGSGVTAYVLHPGAIRTELTRNVDAWWELALLRLAQFTPLYHVLKTPWEGAQTTICCAVSEKFSHDSGLYYADCEPSPTLVPQAEDGDLARSLWELSTNLVGLTEDKQVLPPESETQSDAGEREEL